MARSLYTMQRHILATGKRVIYKVYMALKHSPESQIVSYITVSLSVYITDKDLQCIE